MTTLSAVDASDPAGPDSAPASPTAPRRARRLASRLVVAVVVLGLASLWGYVLYLALGPGRQDSPDKLDDPAFAVAAQARCDAALDLVAALLPASQTKDAATRGATLAEANVALAGMLEDLRGLVPAGEDGEIVGRWLDDWDTYLGDRESYARRLRTDPRARLLVSSKDGDQVTDYIDQFAKDNAMPACSTPADAA